MTKFLAGVLSVIAMGVLMVAYALLGPRSAAFDPRAEATSFTRPAFVGDQIGLEGAYAPRPIGVTRDGTLVYGIPAGGSNFSTSPREVYDVRRVRTVYTQSAAPRVRTIARRSDRDWKTTALMIGGSSAAGAGVGAIFGGKKGALIGAAIGGGASTLIEAAKR